MIIVVLSGREAPEEVVIMATGRMMSDGCGLVLGGVDAWAVRKIAMTSGSSPSSVVSGLVREPVGAHVPGCARMRQRWLQSHPGVGGLCISVPMRPEMIVVGQAVVHAWVDTTLARHVAVDPDDVDDPDTRARQGWMRAAVAGDIPLIPAAVYEEAL